MVPVCGAVLQLSAVFPTLRGGPYRGQKPPAGRQPALRAPVGRQHIAPPCRGQPPLPGGPGCPGHAPCLTTAAARCWQGVGAPGIPPVVVPLLRWRDTELRWLRAADGPHAASTCRKVGGSTLGQRSGLGCSLRLRRRLPASSPALRGSGRTLPNLFPYTRGNASLGLQLRWGTGPCTGQPAGHSMWCWKSRLAGRRGRRGTQFCAALPHRKVVVCGRLVRRRDS